MQLLRWLSFGSVFRRDLSLPRRVFRTPKEDVETAAKAIEADQQSEGFIVRLRGLPYTVSGIDTCAALLQTAAAKQLGVNMGVISSGPHLGKE